MAELPSFIPKTYRENIPAGRGSVGILFFSGMVVFVLSLLIWGGMFFYERLLERQIGTLSASVKRLEGDFEPALVMELANTAKAISGTREVLSGHRSLSRIFQFLEENTLEVVRFSTFNFSAKDQKLLMTGEAKSYTALAEQAAAFEKNPLLKKIFLSNFSLKETGSVNFAVEIIFDPAILAFR